MSESAARAAPPAPQRGPEGTGTVQAVMSELKSAGESTVQPWPRLRPVRCHCVTAAPGPASAFSPGPIPPAEIVRTIPASLEVVLHGEILVYDQQKMQAVAHFQTNKGMTQAALIEWCFREVIGTGMRQV